RRGLRRGAHQSGRVVQATIRPSGETETCPRCRRRASPNVSPTPIQRFPHLRFRHTPHCEAVPRARTVAVLRHCYPHVTSTPNLGEGTGAEGGRRTGRGKAEDAFVLHR